MKYVEMYIDEMKRNKEGLQILVRKLKTKKHHVECVKENKENRWELVQLIEHYNACIKTLDRIISIYSQMINSAEYDELLEEDFKKTIKQIQRLHGQVTKECEKRKIKDLEIKYIESIRPAQSIEI